MHAESRQEATPVADTVSYSFQETLNAQNENIDIMDYFQLCNKTKYTIENFFDLIQLIYSDNDFNVLFAVVGFRKMMSLLKNPPVQSVIDANLLPLFLNLLTRKDIPRIQFEALWTLTNIASGKEDYVSALLDKGAIQSFVMVITEDNEPQVKEQAIWALGNIAGDENFFRNQILRIGAIDPICSCLESAEKNTQFVRNAIWCLANLTRGRPLPSEKDMYRMIPVVCEVLNNTMDEILTDACWCISYISDGGVRTIPQIMETGITERLV